MVEDVEFCLGATAFFGQKGGVSVEALVSSVFNRFSMRVGILLRRV